MIEAGGKFCHGEVSAVDAMGDAVEVETSGDGLRIELKPMPVFITPAS
ncbi:MAG: hypothetical protein K9N48_05225 [Verrucomicrobia bacterium]|nr:hypothetical protein [Verrucomicrobiota bacterium]MCF7708655.1 hypothetical protein [Verrucomicrobiota bacterium]